MDHNHLRGEIPWSDVTRTRGLATLVTRFKLDRVVMHTCPVWAVEVGKVLYKLDAQPAAANRIFLWLVPSRSDPHAEQVYERAAALLGVYELLVEDASTKDAKLLKLWEYTQGVGKR